MAGAPRYLRIWRGGLPCWWGIGIVAGLLSADVLAQQPSEKQPTKVQEIFASARASVTTFAVTDRDGHEANVGVGFIVDANGLIATNLHVIGQGRPFRVMRDDGEQLTVKAIYAWDPHVDLAIVEVAERNLPPLELGEIAAASSGAPVIVLGSPLGLQGSVVAGIVSGVRNFDGRQMIQLAVPVEQGNSGGPVLDHQSRVLGVVTMKSAVSDNLAFAMDVAAVKTLLATPNRVSMARWLGRDQLDTTKWTTLFGAQWRPRGGAIVVSQRGKEFGGRSLCLWHDSPPPVPFEVAVDVRLDDESGAAGLAIHSDGGFRHYGFYPSNGNLRLTVFRGARVQSWTILHDQASSHYLPGEFNSLKVRVEADGLVCFVNDEEVASTTGIDLTTGSVGLVKFRDTQAEFRDFQLGPRTASSRHAARQLSKVKGIVDEIPRIWQWTPADLERLVDRPEASARLLRLRARELESKAAELRRLASDVRVREACQRLDELLRGFENESKSTDKLPHFDLLRASLLIAQLDEEHVDVDAFIEQVDQMAVEIRDSAGAGASEDQLLSAMDRYLFQENGFHGSRFDYYHRANSHMSRVISDRVGLPISLSVLYMELGHRLGLSIDGMNFPDHFMVRYVPTQGEPRLIDVFHEADRIGEKQLDRLLHAHGGGSQIGKLRAADYRDILRRMLTNLRFLAEQQGDREALLRYLEMTVTIDPSDAVARSQRAFLRFETGRRRSAIEDLDWLLEHIGTDDPLRFEAIRRLRTEIQRQAAE